MPSYTHKMAIVSWSQILWRQFTLCIHIYKTSYAPDELQKTLEAITTALAREFWIFGQSI